MALLETIDAFDKNLLLSLNGHHSNFSDVFMWILSEKLTWLPLILALLYVIIKNKSREAILIVVGLALAITFADQISSSIFKPLVERFRPTHAPSIMDQVHIINGYRGGKYGFVSSHAANVFAVALFTALTFRDRFYSTVIVLWAITVAYSRIHLGVHYPLDVFCGGLVGVVSGIAAHWIYLKALLWLPAFRNISSDKPGVFYTSTGYIRKDVTLLSVLFIFFYSSIFICSKLMVEFLS